MIGSIRIVAVVEDTAGRADLLAEHGLCLWIEADGTRVMVDTGRGYVLGHNVKRLGVDISTVDALVLTHGHYDHTGAIAKVLRAAGRVPVYAHPRVLETKYARMPDGRARSIGMPNLDEQGLRDRGAELHLSSQPRRVRDGIVVIGEVPRTNDFEDTGGPFFLDEALTQPDPLLDDHGLVLDGPTGLVVVVGCSHSGIINMLDHVVGMFQSKPIAAVVGGMHLMHAPPERIERTVEALRRLDVGHVVAGHCTGWQACCRLACEFGDRFIPLNAGTVVELATPNDDVDAAYVRCEGNLNPDDQDNAARTGWVLHSWGVAEPRGAAGPALA